MEIKPPNLCTCTPIVMYTCIQCLRLINTRLTWRRFVNVFTVCPQYTMTHTGVTGKIRYRDPLQPQRPRRKQMKATVPRQVIDPRGGFEEDNWCARRRGRLTGNASCQARDFKIVEPADESALDALREEFRKLIHKAKISNQVYSNRECAAIIRESHEPHRPSLCHPAGIAA